MLQFLCLQMCVYGRGVIPQGGDGGPSLEGHLPGGGGGPSSLGWGTTRGGGTNLMLAVGMRDSFCIPGESSSLGRICILPALSQHGDPVWPSLFGPQFEWSKMQKGMPVRCRYRCRCNPRLSKQRLVHVCWGVGAATFWNFECWHSQFGFLWPSMDIRAFDVVLS